MEKEKEYFKQFKKISTNQPFSVEGGYQQEEVPLSAYEFSDNNIQENNPDKVSEPISEPALTFKDFAQHYYNLGFNVTCITSIKNEFNSAKDNFYLKAPSHQWEDLWFRRQTFDEFNNYQWPIAIGFGLATGFNNLLVIDIDDSSHPFLVETLESLGLPIDYEWIVLSGSKKGFHVYVFVENLANVFPKVPVVRLIPKEAYIGIASKVELLIRLHSILPPSIHLTKNEYTFINCPLPAKLPVYVEMHRIQNYIDKYFDPKKQESKKTYKRKRAPIEPEYQCPNKPHGWREIIFGCSLCKAENDRRRAENNRILIEEREERQANIIQERQEKWDAYVELEKEIRAMPRYALWRQDVLDRYGRRCAISNLDCSGDLEVDHFPISLYKLVSLYGIKNAGIEAYECAALWNINNGAVLCKFHHDQTKSSRYRASKP